jgi:two-component system, cell cycle sensor histidine kinase and response regulator CckA
MNLEGVRVLLVEDNPADARYLREEIADVGAGSVKLTHVQRLDEALQKLGSEDFDVVLLDLTLPDAEGLDTLVRAHAKAPSVPIVVLTGIDDEGLAVRAVREGAQDYLVKGKTDGSLLVRAMRYATERKHAIEALQRREEHFRSLIENALDLISIISEDGIIRYVSPSHERVLGYRPDELVGRSFLQLVHTEDAHQFAGAFRANGSPTSIEARVRHKNGAWRVLESFGRDLAHVSGVQGIVINSRDVTERKRAEEALREVNNTLRAVIRTSPLAIYSVDLDGSVRNWNPAAHRMFGWQEWEVLGGPLPHMLENETERFMEHLDLVRTGVMDTAFETRCQTRTGRRVDVTIWNALLRDGSGGVKGVVHMVADVTERKRLEEQLHHSLKMEAVGRLAGGVAHDFNNLLMIIEGYSQMLLSGMDSDNPVRSDLEEILKAAERAGDLTKQLLSFSRRQIVQPKLIDMNSLMHNLERMLKRIIGEDIELVTNFDPKLKSIVADPGQIEQVVLNMTVNARDAMPSGGRLIIETSNVHLDEEYVRSHLTPSAGDYVMFSVTDTGVGIDAETRSHLFEPFFTTKERGKGTGLGLSTSYGIIKQNGGDVWVYSEPGKGTTFKIYLPVSSHQVVPREPRPENVNLFGYETVLLVEDEAGVRVVLEAMLRRHGYEVLSCGSPHDALEICEQYSDRIHLLITDMIMPKMHGRELAVKVRALRPDIQVLYVSGYADANQDEALDPSMHYLQKPFTPEALAAKIRDVMARKVPAGQTLSPNAAV